eukprot:CFRG4650T1
MCRRKQCVPLAEDAKMGVTHVQMLEDISSDDEGNCKDNIFMQSHLPKNSSIGSAYDIYATHWTSTGSSSSSINPTSSSFTLANIKNRKNSSKNHDEDVFCSGSCADCYKQTEDEGEDGALNRNFQTQLSIPPHPSSQTITINSRNNAPTMKHIVDASTYRRSVVMKNRRLASIPTLALENASTLVELNLRRNRITTFPDMTLFRNLKALHLASNGMEVMDSSLCVLLSLEQLFLSDNLLTHLPSEIGRLVNLRVLRVCQNRLEYLPDGIGQCTSLRTLTLGSLFGGNLLQTLPDSLCDLSQLEELDVSLNQLTTLPSRIHELSSLRTLHVSGNQLQHIPSTIGQLERLCTLDLSNNLLTLLPSAVGNLSSLSVLNIRDNLLTRLPGELGWLSTSTSLFISGNPFATQTSQTQPTNGASVNGGSFSYTPSSVASSGVRIQTLQEICGEVILKYKIQIDPRYITQDLAQYLKRARSCTGCRQQVFSRCKREVSLRNLHGHSQVPSTVSLCKASCVIGCSKSDKMKTMYEVFPEDSQIEIYKSTVGKSRCIPLNITVD